jgi:hypothetical protein
MSAHIPRYAWAMEAGGKRWWGPIRWRAKRDASGYLFVDWPCFTAKGVVFNVNTILLNDAPTKRGGRIIEFRPKVVIGSGITLRILVPSNERVEVEA